MSTSRELSASMPASPPNNLLDRGHPLLEREHALALLGQRVSDACKGAGSICLIAGEAGIGKTSLLRHAATARADAARWIWGGCDPLSTPRALGPLYDVARQTGGVLAERLFTGGSRESIFAGVLDAIDEERRPTVLVIEDLHWADQATLDLLLFVGRRIGSRPVALFVTYRDDESATDPLFHATVGALPADVVSRIALTPLSPNGVASLAARAGRSAAGLYETTGGNPFFVTEMLAGDGRGVTPTIRDAVLARTRLLTPAAREALDLVAVMPRAAEADLLERQLGVDLSVVREAVLAGLLIVDGHTIAFRHELARRAIESAADALRHRALHARVLGALTDRRETIGDVPLARLVHHARAAADSDAVRRYAPSAAREAVAASAHREALDYFDLALAHSERLPDEERAELLEGWSVEAYLCGRTTEAIAARRQALAIWRTASRQDRAGAALRWLSRLHWWAGDPINAERAGEDAVRILETLSPGHELAMAYSNLSQLSMLSMRTDAAIAWGERATMLARAIGDSEALAHALTNVGSAHIQRQDDRGADLVEEAFTLASEAHLDDHAQRALVVLATLPLEHREYGRAEPAFERALAYADSHDLDAYAQYLSGQRARMYLERGAWELAERETRRILSQREYPGVTTIPALVVLGIIQARRGDPEATDTLARARERAYPTRELQRVGPTAAALAEQAWLDDDLARVIAEGEPALEMARRVGHEWLVGELAFQLQRAGVVVDTSEAADPWRLLLDGQWSEAAAAWRSVGCPYECAEALASGDEPAMGEALTVFDSLGAVRRARILRRAMRERGLRVPAGPRRMTRANPAGLTSRQMDVLRLLIDGCTNQEIADRFNLASKTVDHHVSAILGKLGAPTRRAAASTARRMGLLTDER
jgi:DNA-binding CsgD family transcriptional regulator/tetratricopeptide (TPR) repeat protein